MSSHKDKYNPDNNIATGFLHWWSKTPDALALQINGKEYSYNELFQLARKIWSGVSNSGQAIIGIYTGKDVYSYAAILAVAMTGAAYIPLNPKYPAERLNAIIKDLDLKIILNAHENSASELSCEVIDVRTISRTTSEYTGETIDQHLAYVLYTSGTTGIPKGVPISKKNINAFFDYYRKHYDFNNDDRFLQAYELSFDVSVFSIFCAWNAGASVHVVPESNTKYIEIFKTIQNNKITVASLVPGVLKLAKPFFKDFNFPMLRYSFFSGDTLYHSDATEWKKCLPNGEIHNFYGPTETTIVCTSYIWNEEQSAKESHNDIVPLGKPFDGMEFIIVDEKDNLIKEINIVGELSFSGTQVIDTYMNNAFAESFFTYNNKHYYKTGDLASLNEQGNLIFQGRKDTQVKINGYRVELLEIEQCIRSYNSGNCKVIAENSSKGNYLVAFIQGDPNEEDKLISHLRQKLAPHMIPAKFLFLKELPQTINGKTDITSLKNLLHEH